MRDFIATSHTCAKRAPARLSWVATLFLTIFSVGWVYSATPADAQSYQFSTIAIDGNVRVDDSTIIGLAGITRGQPVSAGQVNAAISRLSASGLFEDVTVTPRGATLAITVKEYPIIGVVNFEGNRRIKSEQLQEVVRTRAGRVLSPAEVEADARAIAELYNARGRIAAEVTPKILPRGNNRVDLAFEIREGNVVEIERVAFVGNQAFSNYRLRQVLSTKQAGALRWLIQSDTFIAERIGLDRRLLTDFYLSRGYVDFEILSVASEVARERDGFFLTFNLREGQQFKFGQVSVVSEVDGLDGNELQGEIRIRPGTIFAPNVLELSIARLEQVAERKGLRFIRAEPRFTRDNRNGTIDVEFAMVRGERIFVERIDIQGNTATLDRVIRQQFVMAEGDPLNPREIREAAERIRALDYFSDVSVEPRAGSAPDLAVVDVEVDEQPTGSLGFSVSFGANQGVGFGISFSETNFLGRGQLVSATFNTIKGSRDISLFFTEPRMFGRNLAYSLGVGLQETSNQANNRFSTREAFISNALSFPISNLGRLQVRSDLRLDKLSGLAQASSERLRDDEKMGSAVTASLGYTFSYDQRAAGLDPTRGFLVSVSQDFAVGNQSRRSIKTEARVGYVQSILNEDVQLSADARVGMLHMVGGKSRFRERFQLGSIMRGFEGGASGPRDFGPGGGVAHNQDYLGGNRYFAVQMEAKFPLGLPDEYNIAGGVFADIGSVWGLDNSAGINMTSPTGVNSNKMHVRATLGVSLFWDSPLGPLRFDFSRPLRKQAFDKTQNFDFSIVSKF
jgi:outer membrane protein insertion porin family